MGILLQWYLLVLLPTVAHALVRLPVCLVSLLHLLPQRFLVRIAFHVVVKRANAKLRTVHEGVLVASNDRLGARVLLLRLCFLGEDR